MMKIRDKILKYAFVKGIVTPSPPLLCCVAELNLVQSKKHWNKTSSKTLAVQVLF